MHVLIVGGGLAGLSSAITLRENGAAVTVIEAEKDWGTLGAGLSLNGASLRALRDLGVLDEVERLGFTHDKRRLYNASGELRFESDGKRIFGADVPNGGAIMRPVLHGLLLRRLEELAVNVRPGVAAERIIDEEQGIVSLNDGSNVQADMIVCADGFWSPMRNQLFPDAPESRFTGQGCWRAVVGRPDDVRGACTFIGSYKVGVNPVSDEQMYMFLLENMDSDEWIDEADWVPRLKELLSEFGGVIGEIRENLGPDNQVNYRPLKVHVVPPPWYKGRFLLIGDAAHSTTPHAAYGAGLAFEDALVLGDLYGQGLSRDDIFREFVARRYERCRKVVEGSVAIGEVEKRGGSIEEYRAAFEAVQNSVIDS